MFKKMLSALGVGAPEVDTVLAESVVRPGERLQGVVHLTGGKVDVEIERVTLGLVTQVESEHGDHEWKSNLEFHSIQAAGATKLAAQERREIPFELTVPWESPVTHLMGQSLRGMAMGLRTELAVAAAVDRGDLDPVQIEPLPSQRRVLEAFDELGFQFKTADVEQGRLHGVQQTLPFFQEIEFYPPRQFAGVNEVELTFVANAHQLEVILEVDRRGSFYSGGGDTYRRWTIEHANAERVSLTGDIGRWIRDIAARGGDGFHRGHGSHGAPRRGGMGAGAAGGVAAGLLGGMVAGDMLEGFFGDD